MSDHSTVANQIRAGHGPTMAQLQVSTVQKDQSHIPASGMQGDDCFAWIDTLVCDFVYWYLDRFESERVSTPRLVAREFGKAWKMRFVSAQSVDAGMDHIASLVGSGLSVATLQSINEMVAQELKLFFLARTQEPMVMRLSQAKFVDLQSAIIDRNVSFCAQF